VDRVALLADHQRRRGHLGEGLGVPDRRIVDAPPDGLRDAVAVHRQDRLPPEVTGRWEGLERAQGFLLPDHRVRDVGEGTPGQQPCQP
jgi:hypothetical protein